MQTFLQADLLQPHQHQHLEQQLDEALIYQEQVTMFDKMLTILEILQLFQEYKHLHEVFELIRVQMEEATTSSLICKQGFQHKQTI